MLVCVKVDRIGGEKERQRERMVNGVIHHDSVHGVEGMEERQQILF